MLAFLLPIIFFFCAVPALAFFPVDLERLFLLETIVTIICLRT